jgi:CDP-glycerol glycerophosphotransferase
VAVSGIGVIVPVYRTAAWLDECLASLVAQTHREWEAVVVDDGSPDESGEIADAWAAREPRIRVVHTENRGLGAARNEGLRHVPAGTEYLAFLDSDDVLPPDAYATLVRSLERSGSDFACGSVLQWRADGLHELPWMRRLHTPPASGMRIAERPELLGDVFAWNKLFRRSFWEGCGLSWPEGVSYEDQPTTTRAYLDGTVDVLAEPVYHWRIRDDGTSLTQQRATLADLRDRWTTKRLARDAVLAHGDEAVTEVFTSRVLPGDLWRYFAHLPDADDEWYALLESGVRELFAGHSLARSRLTPAMRLTGWLVEQGRRDDAARVVAYAAAHGGLPRVTDGDGTRVDVPGLDLAGVDRVAIALRPDER